MKRSRKKLFKIGYTQFLPSTGVPHGDMPEEYLTNTDRLLCMYRHMVMIRLFDAKAFSLQRQGRVGTNAPTEGEEGYAVGYAAAMSDHERHIRKKHIHIPHYRQNAAMLWRDENKAAALSRILLYWGGSELGNDSSARYPDDHPMCVPIGTQVSIGQGRAYAIKVKNEAELRLLSAETGNFNRRFLYWY